MSIKKSFLVFICIPVIFAQYQVYSENLLKLNKEEYFELPGFNIMVFHDFYPEGHQGGVSVVQHGTRIASNGDIRLSSTPGQWHSLPKMVSRNVLNDENTIIVEMSYPDSSRMLKGFNPLPDPGIHFKYTVTVKPDGQSAIIQVDLDRKLPAKFMGDIGFHIELFPGELFGKSYLMDAQPGIFPRQFNGPMLQNTKGKTIPQPFATGKNLSIAPESNLYNFTIESLSGRLELVDGRARHNNGWYIVREVIQKNTTLKSILWKITPNVQSDWKSDPVIQISQIGYHPDQEKIAVIELDKSDVPNPKIQLFQILNDGSKKLIMEEKPEFCNPFLRYQYLHFNFTSIHASGLYQIVYGNITSEPFSINKNVYKEGIWQPTLTTYLPVQMCHMRINDRYRVWHDICHMDDALMAPVNHNHFDGYKQGESTLTRYKSFEPVPGLNRGGWHDAGDYDLRVESQSGTVFMLALMKELFNVKLDQTTVNQSTHLVEINRPDGKSDILQQIEHGVLTIIGGYQNLGRLYRGIICSDIRQYVMLGDASAMTDNQVNTAPPFHSATGKAAEIKADDRWVFTEENPFQELRVVTGLAAASRVLAGYNDTLSIQCLEAAETIFEQYKNTDNKRLKSQLISPLCELLITTQDNSLESQLIDLFPTIEARFARAGGSLARVFPYLKNDPFKHQLTALAKSYKEELSKEVEATPYGVPYRPRIWGAGWGIQRAGVDHYFLNKTWPEIYDDTYFMNALQFILGRHPGANNASFASGVGSKSVTTAYGVNRADWSYIPGGVVSGTALIRPDLPELKEWPFFWQQTEYVMGGGATHFMFLVLAAQDTYH